MRGAEFYDRRLNRSLTYSRCKVMDVRGTSFGRKHDVVLALPGRVIKMIELCFHHGLLEGSWRFPKETS